MCHQRAEAVGSEADGFILWAVRVGVVHVASRVYVDVVEGRVIPAREEIDVASVGALVVFSEAKFAKLVALVVDGL